MPRAFPYNSTGYEPPAPVVQLSVSVPGSGESRLSRELWALCDTGADLSCLPNDLVRNLGLVEVDEVTVAGYDGVRRVRSLFAVEIQVAELAPQVMRVVAINPSFAIVGRDLLNLICLNLDGPNETLTVL